MSAINMTINMVMRNQDLSKKKICTRTGKVCTGSSSSCQISRKLESGPAWYSPTSMAQLAALFSANSSSTFQFVAGGTGKGNFIPQL